MNWLQKFSNSVKDFASGLTTGLTPEIIPTKIDIDNNGGNLYIQERREAINLQQMKLSWILNQENLEIQERLEESRQEAIKKLAELNYQRNLEIKQRHHQHQEKLEKYIAQIQFAILDKNIDFQQWKLEQEKTLQLQILHLKQEFDREIAQYNREKALSIIREQRKLVNSPINLVSDDLLESPYGDSRMPLRIFLSPPELNYDSFGQNSLGFKIESHLAEELRQFLDHNYPFNGNNRQTELIDGAWVSKKFRGGSGILALYSQLKAVPTIILESEVDANYLNFRVAYWRGDGSERQYKSILSGFPYRDFLYESARERARKWQKVRKSLLAKGKTFGQMKAIGGDNEINLYVLEEEQELLAEGIDIREFDIQKQYKINDKDFQKLHQYLITFHCITVSLIADIHYLLRDNHLTPLLPNLLPELLKDISDSKTLQKTILDWLVATYKQMYKKLEHLMPSWIPELMMQFAVALSSLEDKSYAKQLAEESVKAWLRLHQIDSYSFKSLGSAVTKDDQSYFNSLQDFLDNMGDSEDLSQMKTLLDDWLVLNLSGTVKDISQVTYTSKVAYIPKVKDIPQVIPKLSPQPNFREQEFSFEVVTVDSSGSIIKREKRRNRQQIFDLGNDVQLEMLYIPEGSFMMGAAPAEKDSRDYEKPQHEVTVEAFWIAKYPITQAQYQAITGENPSDFLGDNRPVERVNHISAVEFCRQLSAKLNKEFKLPSEAQWEYACRGGTITPFYFGETITSDLANYNAHKTYAHESKGEYRQQTTPVGTFYPNPFGLYDMHGNVWEWCADNWHDNYYNLPSDGTAWISSTSNLFVIRGGSWNYKPSLCRCAYRNRNTSDYIYNAFGFRCVAPDSL